MSEDATEEAWLRGDYQVGPVDDRQTPDDRQPTRIGEGECICRSEQLTFFSPVIFWRDPLCPVHRKCETGAESVKLRPRSAVALNIRRRGGLQ
jgi:hypothetical protein